MIQFNRYYKSPNILNKYEMVFHNDYLIFSEKSVVRIGVLTNSNEFIEIGCGTFMIEFDKLSFTIQKRADSFKSCWSGIISLSGIQLQIENPDFEDMDGFYELVQI